MLGLFNVLSLVVAVRQLGHRPLDRNLHPIVQIPLKMAPKQIPNRSKNHKNRGMEASWATLGRQVGFKIDKNGAFGALGQHLGRLRCARSIPGGLHSESRELKSRFFGQNGRPTGRFGTPAGRHGGSKIALWSQKST